MYDAGAQLRHALRARLDDIVDYSKTHLRENIKHRGLAEAWVQWYQMIEATLLEALASCNVKIMGQDGRVVKPKSPAFSVAILSYLTKRGFGLLDNLGRRDNIIFLHQSRNFRDMWIKTYRDKADSNFTIPPFATLKVSVRNVHIALKDVAEPGFQNNIAAVFEHIMDRERSIKRQEAQLAPPAHTFPVVSNNKQPDRDVMISKSASKKEPAKAQSHSAPMPNSVKEPVKGEEVTIKFAQAYRNASQSHSRTCRPGNSSSASNSESSKRVIVLPPANTTLQRNGTGGNQSADTASTVQEQSLVDADYEDQSGMLQLVEWLLKERTQLQVAEAEAKSEIEDLRQSYSALQETLEQILLNKALDSSRC